MVAQDVLPSPALRRAAREHGGEPADDVTMFGVDRAAFLLAHGELVERATRAVETGTQLLPRKVAGGGCVGEAAPGSVGTAVRRVRISAAPAAAPTVSATTATTICAFTMSS